MTPSTRKRRRPRRPGNGRTRAFPHRAGAATEGPRYQQVANELIDSIGGGIYPVGALLPTEMELCEQYQISRSTVREALRKLRDSGLIARRRRVGTTVVSRVPSASYRQPTNSISDLLQYAHDTRVEVLAKKRIACDDALAEQLECRIGRAWLRIESLRTIPDAATPVCVTTAYLDARLPNLERNREGIDGPISAMLERTYGVRIARVEQSIQAIALNKRQAKLLKARAGSPALLATRRYYREDGSLVELSSAIHPSDRFTYVTSLVR
ncbi:MAG TPA: GntR family transcriptional regulator [Gemmatimonadaceae bacterium]|nr:GntR family transcriptional regulator [Gemmatimonadaceae bacterium]